MCWLPDRAAAEAAGRQAPLALARGTATDCAPPRDGGAANQGATRFKSLAGFFFLSFLFFFFFSFLSLAVLMTTGSEARRLTKTSPTHDSVRGFERRRQRVRASALRFTFG